MENNIVGEFFLPYYTKTRLLIGGTGDSCKLLNFSARPYNKFGSSYKIDIDRNNCECCIIW